jgi:hypothetical protein
MSNAPRAGESQKLSNLRDLWIFLAGYAYSSPEACVRVMGLVELSAAPEDMLPLLDGLLRRSADIISGWFATRGATIDEKTKAPAAAAKAIMDDWRLRLVRRMSSKLEFGQLQTPEGYLKKVLEVATTLQANGVTVPPELPKPEEKPDVNDDSSAS